MKINVQNYKIYLCVNISNESENVKLCCEFENSKNIMRA